MKTPCADVSARLLVPGLVLVLSAVMLGTEPPERRGASTVEKKSDSVDRDYQAQLPRTAATRPLEAVAALVPRPGFRVEVVAAEPLVQDPVAMEFDENGRLFVCEMPEYNQYANAEFRGKGRVRCLEDTDGNGVFDRSRIFADGIDSPTSVACWKGGVFVGSVPHILYLKDTDGDGTADVRRIVFTGFSRDKAGEAMLNSFRWGLDNRFHVSTNLAGGTVRRAGEKADKGVSVRGRGFVFDPRSESFELSSGGGQHGMSMDNWGRKFVCQNSVPAQLVVYDDRYLARNKFLAGPAPAINIVPSGKQTRLFRRSPIEPWRKLRTRLRSQGLIPGSDEGGKPGGFFTGVTGVTIYRGDAWPEAYHGNLLIGEVSNNLLFRARLKDAGVSLVASRADVGAEFLASKSVWFRPVQLANAPDGTLYVIDMARELIEGAAFLADVILKHMDVTSGMAMGRIYRLVPEGKNLRPPPQLGKLSTAELVALLDHPNGWHRDTASRLLFERQDPQAERSLRRLARMARQPIGRVHALWSLVGLARDGKMDEGPGALTPDLVLAALEDKDPNVRVQALRLSERLVDRSEALRLKLSGMVGDPELRVRYQLAFSLGEIDAASARAALARLVTRDGSDQWVRLAVLSSLGRGGGEVFGRLLTDKKYRTSGAGRDVLVALAGQIGAADSAGDVAAVIAGVADLPPEEKSLGQAVVAGLLSKRTGAAKTRLAGAGGGEARRLLAGLLAQARQVAPDRKRKTADRVQAVRTLGLGGFTTDRKLFSSLLTIAEVQPVQEAVLETLGQFDDPAVAVLLLARWKSLSPSLRRRAAETLFSRTGSTRTLLAAVEDDEVARADLDPARVQLLKLSGDEMIRKQATRLFPDGGRTTRQEVIKRYQPALKLEGDVARGRKAFRKICAACHRLEGHGKAVGAELAGIADRGLDAVLLNVLDPNREVKPRFLSYVTATTEGRIVTGMITAETANSITLQRSDGTIMTVLRVDIEELNSTGLSFMPEGLEKQVTVQMMADLLAYLAAVR